MKNKTNIKTLAFYLPQFHRTRKNDEWWGEGYTDWVAVKEAEAMFERHYQPRIPYKNDYYDLTNKNALAKQAKLMHSFGVDGMVFYHYYFEQGYMALEKPAEVLLDNKSVDMPFCFCWANVTWARTWSKVGGNAWTDKYEHKSIDDKTNILLNQKYGREYEWKKHFEYLISFFKDERYIKVDCRPVLLIHNPSDIACLTQMIEYWNGLCKSFGFDGIYLIAENTKEVLKIYDAILLKAPHFWWNVSSIKREPDTGLRFIDYERMWNQEIKEPPIYGCNTFFGAVSDYDDTPRRGSNGILFRNFSISQFKKGMVKLYKKSMLLNNEFIFINAWNEWGEGMYLEPDEKYGTSLLEAVKSAKKEAIASITANDVDIIIKPEEKRKEESKLTIYRKNMYCLDKWMNIKEKNIHLSEYLIDNDVYSVAIYGYGILGKHLVTELEESKVDIKYIIDRNAGTNNLKYKIIPPQEDINDVDAVIITALGDFENIYYDIKTKTKARIFSIREIVEEIL